MGAKVRDIKRDGRVWVDEHFGGHRRWKCFGPDTPANRAAAEKFAAELNAARANPHGGDRRPLPAAKATRDWLTSRERSLKSAGWRKIDGHIRNHIEPYFCDRDLRTLSVEEVDAFIRDRLDAGYGVDTPLSVLTTLQTVTRAKRIVWPRGEDPFARFRAKLEAIRSASATEVAEDAPAWSPDEIAAILACAGEVLEPRISYALLFLYATGARRGEALGLQRADVDFTGRRIRCKRSIVEGRMTTPKSKRARDLPLSPALAAALRELFDASPFAPPDAFVFGDGTRPLSAERLQKDFARVRRIVSREGVRELTLHSFRHSFATHALQAGKSIVWVARVLGHASSAFTLRRYAHAMAHDFDDLGFLAAAKSPGPDSMRGQAGPAESTHGDKLITVRKIK